MRTLLFQSIRKCFHALLVIALVTLVNKSAKAQMLFDIEGATNTYVTGINDAFDICGYATFPNGEVKGFVRTELDTFIVQHLGANTWFGGINNNGKIVGRYNENGTTFDYHVFIYTLNTNQYEYIEEFDGFGYENVSPNDINDEGWISGDMKDAAQRRIFTYHPDEGLATNFKIVAGTPMPTYGGHHIDPYGMCSAYWVEGIQQKGTFYNTATSSFSGIVINVPDPGVPGGTVFKTQLMGGNSSTILISFPQTRTAYTWYTTTNTGGVQFKFPSANGVYAMDMNEDGFIAGYVLDSEDKAHGFFQANAEIDFIPNIDGWSFGNNDDDCWTEADYGSISYENDPYWQLTYNEELPFPLNNGDQPFPSTTSSSWIEWVQAFGEHQCYEKDPNVNFVKQNKRAFAWWKFMKSDSFEGACGGMCVNAVHVWDDVDGFYDVYPETDGLFSVATPGSSDFMNNQNYLTPASRVSQAKGNSASSVNERKRGYFSGTEEIINIYNGLLSNAPTNLMSIKIMPDAHTDFFHAVVPYKVERVPDNINEYKIYIYDPSYELNTNQYLLLRYEEDSSLVVYQPDNYNFECVLRYQDCSPEMVIHPEMYQYNDGSRDSEIELGFLNTPDITLEGLDGSIVVTEDETLNTISGSIDLRVPTGYYSKPYFYALPGGEYQVSAQAVSETPFTSWFSSGYGIITYVRDNAQSGDIDNIYLEGSKYGYHNSSGESRVIDARVMVKEENLTYTYSVNQINVLPGHKIDLQIIDPTHIMITSTGAATNYDVQIEIFNPETGFWEAVASNVPIGTNVTQLIIPSLTDDTMDGIIIETDANQDGTYEGSEGFDNEGVPNMMLSIAEVEIANTGGSESFHVSNVGAGNLNWNVVYAPSWITVNTGANGVNHGPIEFTVAENTTSAGRQDYLIVEASAPANDQDTVLVIQGEGGVIGIDNIKLNGSVVSIMPNPANDRVHFAIEHSFVGNASFSIYSSTGQLVREGQMRGQKEILNTSQMERGVYQVKFNLNGKIIIKKLVLS